jgi:hypothetical protein
MPQPFLLIGKYLHETTGWKQAVAEIQDRNIVLKSRLSAIVKFLDSRHPVSIERMEYFYDLLLREDEITAFLSDEIKIHTKLLESEAAHNNAGTGAATGVLHEKLGNQVLKVKQDFIQLTTAFNSYAEQVLLC